MPSRIAYHATRNLPAIMADGLVKPMRLPCVYLFKSRTETEKYRRIFGYDATVKVKYDTKDVAGRWYPVYAPHGVVKMRNGISVQVVGACNFYRLR